MATEVSDTLGAEWGGVKALMMLQAGSTAAACLAQYQAYCTSRSITPATASTYVDVWAGSEGLEFLGRNTQVLWWLREAFRVAGDSTNQTLVESYIHAWADACVTMESESGAAGLVKIRGSVSEKPWNAGASAAAGLAMSLAVTSNSTRDTALGRIISAFSAGSMGGPAWAIVSTRNPVQYPLVHYHAYTIFEMARVKKLLPAKTLSADSLIAYPLSMFSGNSKLNEWKANETYRRGASSTHLFVGAAASLFYGRHEVAYELSRHVALQVDAYGGADQMDGWDSSEASAVAMDVRALVEVARWL